MISEDDYLLLSGIQHFIFCKRQWALIHIENQWNENGFTAEGRNLHDRVHSDETPEIRDGVLTLRGLQVKSSKLKITGVCDAVEFLPSKKGIHLHNRKGLWDVRPVEYKKGKSKINDSDRMQAIAQAICLEEMFSCSVNEVCLFYFETRHREYLKITEGFKTKINSIVKEMWKYYNQKYTPKVKVTKACSSCSLNNICLPKIQNNKQSVTSYIEKHILEGTQNEKNP